MQRSIYVPPKEGEVGDTFYVLVKRTFDELPLERTMRVPGGRMAGKTESDA